MRDSSRAWSGYLVTKPNGAVTCVEGAWVEPAVSCPPTGDRSMSIWVGIDGVRSASLGIDALEPLIQVGTQVDCRDGVESRYGWHEVYPTDPAVVPFGDIVNAGDRIEAQVRFIAGTFTLTLLNRTARTRETVVVRAPGASRVTAEWTVEAPSIGCPDSCAPATLPAFGPIRIRDAHVTIDGRLGRIRGPWTHDATDMIRDGITIVRTGALFSTGDSFLVRRSN